MTAFARPRSPPNGCRHDGWRISPRTCPTWSRSIRHWTKTPNRNSTGEPGSVTANIELDRRAVNGAVLRANPDEDGELIRKAGVVAVVMEGGDRRRLVAAALCAGTARTVTCVNGAG
ncbi:hypothetical protein GCM10009555_002070 [Acrocarpospora macrocephala]|uniref:Uncharacterized protein n=1 Tax=Acrocarpospora macrocephala TaxID=150177 RepID=A0A5M3X6M9_9ACTN|nr:hypothetical protein Amac_103320 [Acrocarpospora macrocephala]